MSRLADGRTLVWNTACCSHTGQPVGNCRCGGHAPPDLLEPPAPTLAYNSARPDLPFAIEDAAWVGDVLAVPVLNYDPDQGRDEQGRWAPSGSSAGEKLQSIRDAGVKGHITHEEAAGHVAAVMKEHGAKAFKEGAAMVGSRSNPTAKGVTDVIHRHMGAADRGRSIEAAAKGSQAQNAIYADADCLPVPVLNFTQSTQFEPGDHSFDRTGVGYMFDGSTGQNNHEEFDATKGRFLTPAEMKAKVLEDDEAARYRRKRMGLDEGTDDSVYAEDTAYGGDALPQPRMMFS